MEIIRNIISHSVRDEFPDIAIRDKFTFKYRAATAVPDIACESAGFLFFPGL